MEKRIGRISVLVVLGIFLLMSLTTVVSADTEWTSGGGVVYLTTTGDLVGIGTSTPSHKLEINDASTTANRAGLYVLQNGAVSGTGYGIYATKTSASTTNVGGYFSATGASWNYGLIVGNGYVGIGTIQPDASLDIEELGTVQSNLDILHLTNTANAEVMDGTETSILFSQTYYDISSPHVGVAGRITVGTETSWTSVGETQDSYMAFTTLEAVSLNERMRITSSGNVGIGTTTPVTTLDVNGGFATNIVTKTNADTPYTVTTSDFTIIVDASGGAVTIILPTASDVPGQILVIKRIDVPGGIRFVTITGTIDGVANPTLVAQWDSVMIQSNGTTWYKLADK